MRALGRCWRWRLPPRRRERPTPLAAAGSDRQGPFRSEAGGLRRSRGHKGRGGRRDARGRVAAVRGALRAQRPLLRAGQRDERGGRGSKGDLQGQAPEDGTSPGQGVRATLRQAFPEGRLRFRGWHRGRPELLTLPRKPPCPHTHDEHARAPLSRDEEENEGGGSVPQRDECEHAGHRDSIEEHRAVGAEALPQDGRPRSGRKDKPTTFETLTRNMATDKSLTVSDICRTLGIGRTPFSRYVKAGERE